jgi:hypothetical protein
MWIKLLSVLIVLALVFGIISLAKNDSPESTDTAVDENAGSEPPSRAAGNIVMHEKKAGSDTSLVIRADSVTESADNVVFLEKFRLVQSDGLTLTGDRARYDTGESLLDIIGPVTVHTADGWKAELDGLRWNRMTKKASTDRPLVVKGAQGTIEAGRGEFFDDFSRILLSGDVHAKVSPDLLHN